MSCQEVPYQVRSCFKAWQERVDSGDAGEIDFKSLKQEARARLATSKA